VRIDQLLEKLWQEYLEITPTANIVNKLLEDRGELIENDHIAIRTFAHKKVNKEKLAIYFKEYGYEVCGNYEFSVKKLDAVHLENTKDRSLPKIFISELKYKELSSESIKIIERVMDELEELNVSELFNRKQVFNISHKEYLLLESESEYAAWLCAIGYRPNHFTINVNQLKSFKSVLELNAFLKDNGISLNSSGGEVKGSPDVYLEQSSTMADSINTKFSDKEAKIPSCYYEFAYRYKLQDGDLYQGFVAKSADKIFESTNG
jgi:hypothetical protein